MQGRQSVPLGVIFDALSAQLAWWPWMFLVASRVRVFLALLVSFVLLVTLSLRMRISFKEKLQDIDWLGAFSNTALY